ncbi:four helix bundle protein [Dehalococcoidales bacterium]|nr:four helix bundle protein [Dehalococcoidales bacterium]
MEIKRLKMGGFEDLEVWQIRHEMVISIYELTKSLPREEAFGLTSQIKRAALSVPANIAEGFGRYHYMDKAKFYLNARGSLYELKSHLLIAFDLGYLPEDKKSCIFETIESLSLKLNNLITTTRRFSREPKPAGRD